MYQLNLFPLFILLLHILLFTTPTIPPIFKSIAQNSTYFFFQKGAFKKNSITILEKRKYFLIWFFELFLHLFECH